MASLYGSGEGQKYGQGSVVKSESFDHFARSAAQHQKSVDEAERAHPVLEEPELLLEVVDIVSRLGMPFRVELDTDTIRKLSRSKPDGVCTLLSTVICAVQSHVLTR